MPACRRACLFYIGGIIKHAKAINAFTNPLTNSYKRLVPGYEAPVLLAYSARNRSASCRIPFGSSPKSKRVEVRFPDPGANPYLGFAAMLMAGLDGIKNKIHPGQPMDKDLYDLPPKELKKIPTVCGSLREALQSLDKDRGFLKAGGVFDDDQIDAYIELKMAEVMRFEMTPHPVEYDMYYSVETLTASSTAEEAAVVLRVFAAATAAEGGFVSRFSSGFPVGVQVGAQRVLDEQHADDQRHRRDHDRIPEAVVDVALGGAHREHRRRQQAAEPAIADVIGQRHAGIADAGREHLDQDRRDRAVDHGHVDHQHEQDGDVHRPVHLGRIGNHLERAGARHRVDGARRSRPPLPRP